MINAKNELQYLLVVQTLENAAHEGLLRRKKVRGHEIPPRNCLGITLDILLLLWYCCRCPNHR